MSLSGDVWPAIGWKREANLSSRILAYAAWNDTVELWYLTPIAGWSKPVVRVPSLDTYKDSGQE